MKASELRIGNLITYQGNLITVSGVVNNTIYYENGKNFDSNSVSYTPFEPIPLTEDWLLKFGFVNGEKEHFSFTKNMDLRILGSEADYNGIWFGRLESVHQLQNLYFALTGEELTVRE